MSVDPDYPLAGTRAQKMLAEGLARAEREHDLSGRRVAATLNYKSSVVISHMANGRVPIPIDRAADLARVIGMDVSEFTLAVLQQRFPDIDFVRLISTTAGKKSASKEEKTAAESFVEDLQFAAGVPIDRITTEQMTVMREVASYPNAHQRWASINEAGIVRLIRERRPDLAKNGLAPADRKAFVEFIDRLGK